MALRLRLRGSVQGVGFRPWLWRTAHSLQIRGSVANEPGGVRIDAFGGGEALDRLLGLLAAPPLPGADVESIDVGPLTEAAPPLFDIAGSQVHEAGAPVDVALAPDLPTCPRCERELADPTSRRHRYPFIACAHCGPRYTMARALPYDRARTAMADFPLCAECAEEYRRPDDRRFHAEATACPTCGPGLFEATAAGEAGSRDEDALARAHDVLRAGGVVAVQGIGGFHLACDACDEAAVRRLRARKRRPRKPLAVMVGSLAEAEKHAVISADERTLLGSTARPIVVLRRRSDSALASSVAPGIPMVGLLLAYSPLHALLLQDFGGPLVMTSANRSGEPIAYRLEEARDDLLSLADMVLAHDREIAAPCDDSVALAGRDGPIVLRRSRGAVPRAIRLARPVARTVLALGGQWNDTVCIARGDRAWLSAHVGDVESPATARRVEETVQRWLDWLGVEPDVVAHDLHPGYETTRLADAWRHVRRVAVQHHHAHMAAVLGEHGHTGPALGLAWDGTGLGHDGTAWGGELLFGDARAVQRLATLRPIALAGGERAIREPWRLALALLDDAFDGAPPLDVLGLFRRVSAADCERVRALLRVPGLAPAAHGVGRYFDAVGALLLERPQSSHQGELAAALGFLARGGAAPAYPFALLTRDDPGSVWSIDLRPAVRALVDDLRAGEAPPEIADRFHATLCAAGAAAVREALRHGPGAAMRRPVLALGGGCFQNPLLQAGLADALAGELDVIHARELPPGDGGLALGQALVGDAVASARPADPMGGGA